MPEWAAYQIDSGKMLAKGSEETVRRSYLGRRDVEVRPVTDTEEQWRLQVHRDIEAVIARQKGAR